VGLEATANLAVAALDLKLVQLVRGAMRAADAASCRSGLPLIRGEFAIPRLVIHPRPRFDPRPVIHPTPRFLARPILHPTPRIDAVSLVPADPEQAPRCSHGLPPPWKMPLWNVPIPPKPTIKRIVRRTDLHHKGSLLDLFI